NFALILHVHPFVGIELALGVIAQRHAVGDLAGDIVDLEVVDAPGATFRGKDIGPCGFYAASERGHGPHSRYNNAAQFHRSSRSRRLTGQWPGLADGLGEVADSVTEGL